MTHTIKPRMDSRASNRRYNLKRIDWENGLISYEIIDCHTYRMLCSIYEDPGEERSHAKIDAELIVQALNYLTPQ